MTVVSAVETMHCQHRRGASPITITQLVGEVGLFVAFSLLIINIAIGPNL